MKRIVFLALVLAACSASAQVTKCKLSNGTITYGDGPCPAGAVDSRVNTTANVVDGSDQRAAAARMRDDQVRNEQPAPGATIIGSSKRSGGPIDEAACRAARRDLDMAGSRVRTEVARGNHPGPSGSAVRSAELKVDAACGTSIAASRAASTTAHSTNAAPPPIPEAPAQIVNCDPAGCWDTAGRRYNNAAGGNFSRSDGAFCTRAGPNAICN
ncbi:DUF4124 domain-containing protein [Variovorax sp. RB3P1]|uniref:DUF4124 domain-containing protein n=1 Tax=Variovorax sp. RB3P1 TaxID=3443732 RepID=UPI003F46FED0